jgi:hypothetical protein
MPHTGGIVLSLAPVRFEGSTPVAARSIREKRRDRNNEDSRLVRCSNSMKCNVWNAAELSSGGLANGWLLADYLATFAVPLQPCV